VQRQKEEQIGTHPVKHVSHGPRFRLGKRTFTFVGVAVDLAGPAVPENVVVSVAIGAHKFAGFVGTPVLAPLGVLGRKEWTLCLTAASFNIWIKQ